MAELSWQSPDWRGWPWVRRALFLLPLGLVGTFFWIAIVDYSDIAPLHMVLFALTCWLAASRRPQIVVTVFLAVFLLNLVVFPTHLGLSDGPAWILAMAVVLDANSRSPVWFGLFTTLVVASGRAPVVLYEATADNETFLVVLALMGATLIGQLIRGAFAAGRAAEAAAEARRLVERLEMRHAVHDSGSARLAQLMLLTRALRDRPELPAELRGDVDLMVDVATSGAQELRAVMQPRADEPAALAREWRRSVDVLGSAGFEVVEASLSLPPLGDDIEREAVRVVREATSNICKHAAPRGRVVAASAVGGETLTLTWLSDCEGAPGEGSGLGLAGMAERIKRIGGTVQTALADDSFRLCVTLPTAARCITLPTATHG
ncbi:MAG: hypothetical protein IPJ61_06615 [Tessaracoccus sp.]|uniref:sensor histidine kinase n=1 Tax=Tessaracoccus sp. TaxID=1971211 RepID=UPI001EC31A6B|nr:hypothetical protein [Tessaracoccus sp.]MBK7820743.1 hypothetical protein [Tessaracoccus sp.]